MGIDLNRFQELKTKLEKARQDRDRTIGALNQQSCRLRELCGTTKVNEARRLIDKLRKKLDRLERLYNQELEELEQTYGERLRKLQEAGRQPNGKLSDGIRKADRGKGKTEGGEEETE